MPDVMSSLAATLLLLVMDHDHQSMCVNFRDVGESLELLADARLFPSRCLYRGGKIDYVSDLDSIQNPATIVNLRRGVDPKLFPVSYAHFPASNDLEKYKTENQLVRRWLNDVVAYIADPSTNVPVLVHCASGKDRTGVVIAALLAIVGIDRSLIVGEYLLSSGEVHRDRIELALDGFGNPNEYFNRVDLNSLRRKLAFSTT